MNVVQKVSTIPSNETNALASFTDNALKSVGFAAVVLGALWLAIQPETARRPQLNYVGDATIH